MGIDDVPAAYHSSSDTDDDAPAPPPQHARRHLTLEDVLTLGRGDDLPSPTPSSESDGTISDDTNLLSPASVVVAAPLDGGWAATGKRGWAGGKPAPLILNAQSSASHSSNVSSDSGSAHAAAVHQPAAQLPQPQQPVAPQQHPRREYTCKECGRSFPTNQALGGHAAGHRNRQREAEAAAAAAGMVPEGEDSAALRRGREEAPHECRKCGKVFTTGVALGGHMRVHYTGPPIVPARKTKKRCLARLPLAVGDIAAAAPPPPGLSLKAEAPSPAPAGGGTHRVVRLFGIDICPQVHQAPSEQQQCSGMTEDS